MGGRWWDWPIKKSSMVGVFSQLDHVDKISFIKIGYEQMRNFYMFDFCSPATSSNCWRFFRTLQNGDTQIEDSVSRKYRNTSSNTKKQTKKTDIISPIWVPAKNKNLDVRYLGIFRTWWPFNANAWGTRGIHSTTFLQRHPKGGTELELLCEPFVWPVMHVFLRPLYCLSLHT